MATREQIEATYNYMDEILRLSLGEAPDLSCAFFDGDFSKTLEQAQKDKHDYVLDALNFGAGSRLLDIGCGWGPVLKAAEQRGGRGIGLTLSTKQAESCRRNGFEVHLKDWRDIDVDTFGIFDGITSIGSFEHFCSVEEYRSGNQDDVYQRFFQLCHKLLTDGGRLYLQTMIWGRNAPPIERISLHANKGSNEYILALLGYFYPGSWLPNSKDSIIHIAEPYFTLVSANSGRKDYIETLDRWKVIWNPSPRKALVALKLLPLFLRDQDFRYQLRSLLNSSNKECFKREVMDHERMVFQKR